MLEQMKLVLLILIIISCSKGIFPRDTTGNLLTNSGFEIVKDSNFPEGWIGDSRVYSLNSQSASGKYSLEYSNNDPSLYKVCMQILYVKPGLTYSAGVKIKTEGITGSESGATFCVEWLDKNGKWFGGVYPKGIKGTNNWKEVTSLVSVPDDAAKILFCCYVRKGMTGTAWFDDAYLTAFNPDKMEFILLKPTYRNLLFNDADQEIILLVNLKNINRKLDKSVLKTVLTDSSGKELNISFKNITNEKLTYTVNFKTENIPIGIYKVKTFLYGKDHQIIDYGEIKIEKITGGSKPKVYFNSSNSLIVNDKAVFPLGMYWSLINEDDLKIYADSKFNFLLPYNPPDDEQMKLVAKYNLKVIYSVKDFYFGLQRVPSGIKSVKDENEFLSSTVNHFKDDPALLAWYNNDELLPDYMDRLVNHYKIISGRDYNHPILSIIVNPNQVDLYSGSTDIIGTDPYVVPKSSLSDVGKQTITVNKKLNSSRPVWMIIQAHNLGNYTEFISRPEEYRSPSYDEMRCMAWQAICNGATGLIFYSFFDLKRNKDVSFDEQWNNLKKIAEEINKFSDILLSMESAKNVIVSGVKTDSSWFSWKAIKYQHKIYLFIVNNGITGGRIKITIPAGYSGARLINNSPESFPIINSEIQDNLPSLGFNIYRFE